MAFIAATPSFRGCTFMTKVFCEFDFIRSVKEGDIVQITVEVRSRGRSSVRVAMQAKHAVSGEQILQTKAVLVHAQQGRSIPIPDAVAQSAAATAAPDEVAEAPARRALAAEGGLWLRPVASTDAVALLAAARDSVAEVAPWTAWCDADYQLEHARSWASRQEGLWARGEQSTLTIEEEGSEGIAGTCGFNAIHRDAAFCNLAYWVRTSGTGLASRTARRVAQFGVEELGLGRIEILAAVENVASQRAAEKAGSTREAVLRRRLVVREKVFDAMMFALTRP